MLEACLAALEADGSASSEVLVLGNSPFGDDLARLTSRFPGVRFVQRSVNDGYGAACNEGARSSTGEYLFFLNNDIEVEVGCLGSLVEAAEADATIAAAQPKLLSARSPERFDYAGAAGGLMDRFGHLYARGRLFDTIERDAGQYDEVCDIFWATGAALFVRRDAFEACGGFEPAFFLHMEEIDLAWRLHYQGHRVVAVPTAVALHVGSPSLGRDSARQLFLNHRNNLIVLFRNYGTVQLLTLFPLRLILELGAALYSLASDGGVRALAIGRGLVDLMRRPGRLLALRRAVAPYRENPVKEPLDRAYRGSIAVDYFLRRRRKASELPGAGSAGFEPRAR